MSFESGVPRVLQSLQFGFALFELSQPFGMLRLQLARDPTPLGLGLFLGGIGMLAQLGQLAAQLILPLPGGRRLRLQVRELLSGRGQLDASLFLLALRFANERVANAQFLFQPGGVDLCLFESGAGLVQFGLLRGELPVQLIEPRLQVDCRHSTLGRRRICGLSGCQFARDFVGQLPQALGELIFQAVKRRSLGGENLVRTAAAFAARAVRDRRLAGLRRGGRAFLVHRCHVAASAQRHGASVRAARCRAQDAWGGNVVDAVIDAASS